MKELGDRKQRKLTPWMLNEFKHPDGMLHPILQSVLEDSQQRLDFAIRAGLVDVYYQGGTLMEIRQPNPKVQRVKARWDKRYLRRHAQNPWDETPVEETVADWLEKQDVLGLHELVDRETVLRHVESFPQRMTAMDACRKHHRKRELKTQQALARSCNASLDGEFLICDTEYSIQHDRHATNRSYTSNRKNSRIDLVAAQWPRGGKGNGPARLVLIELKHGVAAMEGPAGIRSHVRDVQQFLVECCGLQQVADDMKVMVDQKHQLGLVPTPVDHFDLTPPIDYVIAVADHKPKSQILRDALFGRNGLDEGPLVEPPGIAVSVAIIDEEAPTLSTACMLPLGQILAGDLPVEVFCGRRLRPRRRRADEKPVIAVSSGVPAEQTGP